MAWSKPSPCSWKKCRETATIRWGRWEWVKSCRRTSSTSIAHWAGRGKFRWRRPATTRSAIWQKLPMSFSSKMRWVWAEKTTMREEASGGAWRLYPGKWTCWKRCWTSKYLNRTMVEFPALFWRISSLCSNEWRLPDFKIINDSSHHAAVLEQESPEDSRTLSFWIIGYANIN